MREIHITDVRALPGDSAFLLDDGVTAILYDSGFGFTADRVADNVRAILGERPLDYIFLTHSHYDHALGSAYLRRHWPEVKVVAGAYAAGVFTRPGARAVMRELDRKFAAACGVSDYEDRVEELTVDISVEDGDRVRAGAMEFTVLHLPGHTKCSVGYYCPEARLFLSCETLGVYNGVDQVVPSYLVGYQMTLDAIDRVAELDIDQILLPHYGVIRGEEASFYQRRAKESAVETAAMLADCIRRGESREEAVACYRERFYHGYVKDVYPVDAMELNTGITVDLLIRELGLKADPNRN